MIAQVASDLIVAIGLLLVLEGLVYALAPSFVESLLEFLRSLSMNERRQVGFVALALGAVMVVGAKMLGG